MTDTPVANEVVCYSKIEAGLEDLKARHHGVVVDTSTKEGMITAIKGRAELRDIRITLEETRKKEKKFYLDYGERIDAKAKEIFNIVSPMEKYYDAEIKREENRKKEIELAEKREEERLKKEAADKIQAEKDRIAAEEKKKFDDEQEKLRIEKKASEDEKAKVAAEQKARQDKIDADNKARQDKLDEEERAVKKRIDDLERESRLKIENEQRESRERQAKIDAEEKRIKDEAEKKAKEELDKLAKIKAEKEFQVAQKKRIEELKKQKRLDGFSLLKAFVEKHSDDKEFKEPVEFLKEWLENEGEK